MGHFSRTLWQAAHLWYDRDADLMAATVSYYALFAFVPLLLITITISGVLFGGDYVSHILLGWGAVLGPDVLALLSDAVQNLDQLTARFSVPLIGVLFFSGMVLVLFNTITSGFLRLWGESHQGFSGWLKKCLRSFIFVVILEGFVLLLIGVDVIVLLLEETLPALLLTLLQSGVSVVAVALILALAYGVLPWVLLPYRARLYGALVASVLFALAKFLVEAYVAMTPVPGLYGVAGLLIVLLIWLYATSCIVYYGAALAYVRSRHS